MGNVVQSVEMNVWATRDKNQTEDQEFDYVIDMDLENWQEKVKEYKKLWYACHSNNSKDNTKREVQLSQQQESNMKKLNTDKFSNMDFEQQELTKSEQNQNENDFKVQAGPEGRDHCEQSESCARSRERIKFFRKKYKLCKRDYTTNNNIDLTDKTTEKEDREQSKKLRQHIRKKYQLPVKGCHSGTVDKLAYN